MSDTTLLAPATGAAPQPAVALDPPRIVVSGGQKGGTGKTSLSYSLIVMAAKAGLKVLAIDADRANGLSSTFDLRGAQEDLQPRIVCVQKLVANNSESQAKATRAFAREIATLAQDYDLVFVDTAGFDADDRKNAELRGALLVADFFLCPSRPGHLDRRALPQVWAMVEEARYVREQLAGDEAPPPLDALCVFNATPTNPLSKDVRIARGKIEALVPDLPLADFTISHRSIYTRCLETGLAAIEARPDAKERTELLRLYRGVLRRDYKQVL